MALIFVDIYVNYYMKYIFKMSKHYNAEQGVKFIDSLYDSSLIPSLGEFVSIPNLSRNYDKEYLTNGLLFKAATHIKDWVVQLGIKGCTCTLVTIEGKAPIILT